MRSLFSVLFTALNPYTQHVSATPTSSDSPNSQISDLRSQRDATNTTRPLVKLDYITLRGAYSPSYNLTHYRRIPFAASTAGQNRFRAPQPPVPFPNSPDPSNPSNGSNSSYGTTSRSIYDTDRDFDMCPQRTVNGSEDCLYLGIYSRPWKKGDKLRPVLLTFYGGGFIQGSASFSISPNSTGPSGFPVLNASSLNDYVVVYSNYRTNVFGFLSGKKIKEGRDKGLNVDLNVGLLDQREALRWVRRYIGEFGGDKGELGVWGQSAGAGSVVAQMIADQKFDTLDEEIGANGKKNKGKGDREEKKKGKKEKLLFKRSMTHSPFWPKTYRYDSPESEALYEQVVSGVGCKNNEAAVEIKCLKEVHVQKLRDVSLKISTQNTYTTSSYTWGPVIDDSFLSRPLSEIISDPKARLNSEEVLANYNLHEGENFLPPGLKNATGEGAFNSSAAGFEGWVRGFLPNFGDKEIEGVKDMYPEVGVAEEIKWDSTWERAGMVYRDLVLACPAFWIAGKARKGWLSEYTINPAKHASDTVYWNTINPVQVSDPLTYQGFTGAMASFVQAGDPNAHKLTNDYTVGVPRINTGRQFLVTPEGLKQGRIDMLEKRCAFWLKNARKVPF